jgi:hypothetical protein
MNEANVYISNLLEANKLSYSQAQIFLDYAYDLVLDGYSDSEIESMIIKDINKNIQGCNLR